MMTTHRVLAGAIPMALVALAIVLPARVLHADVYVQAYASAPGEGHGVAELSPADYDESIVAAYALSENQPGDEPYTDIDIGATFLSPFTSLSVTPPWAQAAAGVNANEGTLRARAFASGDNADTYAGAEARLSDNITFINQSVINLHLDINEIFRGDADASVELTFAVRSPTGVSDFPYAYFLLLYFTADASGTYYAVYDDDPYGGTQPIDEGAGSPPKDFVLDFGPLALNRPFSLEVLLDVFAASDSSGAANIRADHTGYIGIPGEHLSANGYLYPGYVVPEPAAFTILALGLGAMTFRRRMTSNQPKPPQRRP